MSLENQILWSFATSTRTGEGTACECPSGDGLLVFHPEEMRLQQGQECAPSAPQHPLRKHRWAPARQCCACPDPAAGLTHRLALLPATLRSSRQAEMISRLLLCLCARSCLQLTVLQGLSDIPGVLWGSLKLLWLKVVQPQVSGMERRGQSLAARIPVDTSSALLCSKTRKGSSRHLCLRVKLPGFIILSTLSSASLLPLQTAPGAARGLPCSCDRERAACWQGPGTAPSSMGEFLRKGGEGWLGKIN